MHSLTKIPLSICRVIFCLCILILAFIFPDLSPAQNLNLPLKWTTNQKSFLESAAIVADVNNDGWDEVVFTGQEELIVLGKDGKALWRWRTKARFMTYPGILQRKGESALIYAADNGGQFSCLDGTGNLVWQTELPAGSEWCASVIADLDGDKNMEVIQTTLKGHLVIYDALSGNMKHRASTGSYAVSPAVADVDDDGQLEIAVVTVDGAVQLLKNDGTKLWQVQIGESTQGWSASAPVIFAASDGNAYIVAASSSGDVYCFNAEGESVWQYPTQMPIASSISVGDFDLDGQADIFLITQTGIIFRFNETGDKLWRIDMQGRSLASGAIIDMNNDGTMEYVLSTQRGHVLALSNDGAIIFDKQLQTRTINVTPAFGNITGNSRKLEMAITGGEAGLTFCFETPANKSTLQQWPTYRGDIRNTGSWFGLRQSAALRMIPRNLRWNQIFSGSKIKFDISNPNPTPSKMLALARCIAPDGAQFQATATILGGSGQLQLPVDFGTPGNYKFTWQLTDENGQQLLHGERDVVVHPFANDQALVQRAIGILRTSALDVSPVLLLSAEALGVKKLELEARMAAVGPRQHAFPGLAAVEKQTVIEETARLNVLAENAIAVSRAVRSAKELGKGTSLVAFVGEMWNNRGVDEQIPTKAENPLQLKYSVVPGEHQPVPLVLFNVTHHLLNVRTQIGATDAGIVVTPLRSVDTPTSLGEVSWDALPELDESGVISIPPLQSREIWLDVEFADVQAGNYPLEIIFQALNGAGVLDAPTNPHEVPAPETRVDIQFEVLPFTMAASGDFRLCTWSPSTDPEIPDLLAHGNNVFLVHHGDISYDENGIISSVDFSNLDPIVQQFTGVDVFLLIHGFPNIKGDFGSDKYTQDFADYLPQLVAYLAEKGFTTDQFALYPIDEPAGHGWSAVNKLVQFGKLARSINPAVMIYQDGGGELPMFHAMAPVLDVWVPPFDWLGIDLPEMEVMRTNGKHMWSYNCSYTSSRPIGPNVKNINLLYEFRLAALTAFRHGASGIGFWCYNAGRENPWSRIRMEYNLIYPGRTKPVTSRRWEAVREGIEDYRILAVLRDLFASKNGQLSTDAREKIRHLLQVSLPNLIDPAFATVRFGYSREAIEHVANSAKMQVFLQEMIGCVKAVVQ
ncbi:MAG: DUF4091 domain-containing protein [Deferribacteres bacterium]|nr:DUF4091 domain-containing protein [candidate division KSB1 bacterium]MCB9501073.1 DUF4091 domain-containing protein [Deferribacteres bacterium]